MLLSIIIPTRNRQYYCFEVVKHILSLELPSLEVIIQDNSDDYILHNLLKPLLEDNDNITYNYISHQLSFVDNFSRAIELSKGEYVCMIGDDDTILPNIIDVVQEAKINDYDVITPSLITYFWPTGNPIKEEYRRGLLKIRHFNKPRFKKINRFERIKALVDNSFQNYQSLNIPRIYHGLVKRELLEAIKSQTGQYFGGLTPDMYMSVCLCCKANNAVSFNLPISISGICPKSGSSDSATGKHTGELKDAPHFKGHTSYNWNSLIPYIYTVETIWAETGLHALEDMKQKEEYIRFDPGRFAVELSLSYPQFHERLLEFGRSYGITNKNFRFNALKIKLIRKLRRVRDLGNKICKLDYSKPIYNVNTINEACNIANRFLNSLK